jgi:CubicO group peptidase (beta-lactamase class C family)
VPASVVGSRLSGLRFIDPQDGPGPAHVVVPGTGGPGLPSAPRALRVEVAGGGRVRDLAAWLEDTVTTSLLVVAGGSVVHEWYAAGHGPGTRFLGASMTKSALGHLVGRAVAEGRLGLEDAVCDHVPELRGSGYDGTTVLDVLTMTSGVAWLEDHRDPASPASRLLGAFLDGRDSRPLLREVRAGVPPGTRWEYSTADSQVLDWVRERATGVRFVDDLARLWSDLGCAEDAFVVVDGEGVALAGGGLAATARSWARLGSAAATAAWSDAAAVPAYPFTRPGRLPSTISGHVGFGHHWWPLDDHGHRFAADGSRGQLVAVDRRAVAVAVKTSLWPHEDAWVDRQHRDLSYLGLHALLDALLDPLLHPLLECPDPHTEGETRP